MKTLLFVFGLLVVVVLGTGCAGVGAGHGPSWGQVNGVFGQSELPPDPVNNSSSFYRNWDGSINYSHWQGTENHAHRSFDPYYGPREDVRQSTYNHTTLNITPRPRYWGGWR